MIFDKYIQIIATLYNVGEKKCDLAAVGCRDIIPVVNN